MKGTTAVQIEDSRHAATLEIPLGISIVEAISSAKDFSIQAACGGNGTCGKCRVRILSLAEEEAGSGPSTREKTGNSGVSEPDELEQAFLSQEEIERGIRLGCRTTILGPCRVQLESAAIEDLPEFERRHGAALVGSVDPPLRMSRLSLETPTLEDQRSDERRLFETLSQQPVYGGTRGSIEFLIPLTLLRKLPALLREGDYEISVLHSENEIFRLEAAASPSAEQLGLAVDIGTTSIAAYLVDLSGGEILSSLSRRSRQADFGADVISRISAYPRHGERLRLSIVEQIEAMALELLARDFPAEEAIAGRLVSMAAVGNTVMLHLLAGLDPQAIGEAPFIPVTTGGRILSGADLGFSRVEVPLVLPPGVSAYIGSDISAGIIATGMDTKDETALLVDIGTNGEIVLKHQGRYYACSAAAGPAFEGAGIACGMGYDRGAVEAVAIGEGELRFSIVGGESCRGICGSGILDAAASLLEAGLADYTGRILEEDEMAAAVGKAAVSSPTGSEPVGKRAWLSEVDGEPALLFRSDEEGRIYFSQRDMRQVQNAKAAVAAGIHTLLQEAGISPETIEKVYLAGGFGSFLRAESALAIGLIPREAEGRIEQMGNTAGKGAVMALLSRRSLYEISRISEEISYIELSSHGGFMERYVEEMFFPERDGSPEVH